MGQKHVPPPTVDPRSIWDSRYASMRQRGIRPTPDAWLEGWSDVLAAARGGLVLDLGCGSGLDSQTLKRRGLAVVAADFSREALSTARQSAQGAQFVQADLRCGLPFQPGSYRLVVANLVLHYYGWSATLAIVEDIRRCLEPGGRLLARLNSVQDVQFGAEGHPEIEPGLYLVQDVLKRFFDRASIEELFSTGWRLAALQERKTVRYLHEKQLWEVLLRKT